MFLNFEHTYPLIELDYFLLEFLLDSMGNLPKQSIKDVVIA
ncbi:hypothetical protein MWLp12_0766 [Lactiplantibacillus plantarum]|nr:hypothetical protein MWLp12_0766 [Lactiplantibacillus plantarum]